MEQWEQNFECHWKSVEYWDVMEIGVKMKWNTLNKHGVGQVNSNIYFISNLSCWNMVDHNKDNDMYTTMPKYTLKPLN